MTRRLIRLSDVVVLGGIVAGVALRVWILASSMGTLDGDEAVWGTMARQLLRGDFSVFMWGQGYGGTQEVLLSAPLVAVLGANALAIRLVPIGLWALAAILLWRVGRRLIGEPAARFAAVLFWIWPTYFVWKSTRAHGFYGSTLVLGLVVLLLTLRLRERCSRRDLALLGLALGCGLWASPQIAIFAVPAIVWLVLKRPQVLQGAWLVGLAAVVGALPWLVANARRDWESLSPGVPRSDGLANIHNLLVATTPTALGLRVPFSLQWIGGAYVGAALYLAALITLAAVLVRRRSRLGVLILIILLFPLLYYISPFTWLNDEPRYLLLISPVIALVIGSTLTTSRRGAIVLPCALAFSVIGLGIVQRGDLAAVRADEGVVVPDDIRPLVRILGDYRISHVYSGYWLAWRLTYETRERIIGATTNENVAVIRDRRVDPNDAYLGRYPPFYRRVRSDPNAAHVFLAGGDAEPRVSALLRRTGYTRIEAGGFVVYVPPGTRRMGGARPIGVRVPW